MVNGECGEGKNDELQLGCLCLRVVGKLVELNMRPENGYVEKRWREPESLLASSR